MRFRYSQCCHLVPSGILRRQMSICMCRQCFCLWFYHRGRYNVQPRLLQNWFDMHCLWRTYSYVRWWRNSIRMCCWILGCQWLFINLHRRSQIRKMQYCRWRWYHLQRRKEDSYNRLRHCLWNWYLILWCFRWRNFMHSWKNRYWLRNCLWNQYYHLWHRGRCTHLQCRIPWLELR